ncbi:MAG TPA: aminopeptidase N [Euzebyales bacterium]|nr:aminopeptidase N [Euzebyales bacterium]
MSDTADVLARDDAERRARLLHDVAYDVTLDLGDGRGEAFLSTSRVTFGCVQPGADTFIDLTAVEVVSATLNGHALPASAFSGRRLHLNDLAADNDLAVVARCPFQHTGTGLHRFVDPADDAVYLHTQFEPFDAHTVYACFDQPDLKARFRLTARAPSAWTVVSNEPVASRTTGSDGVDVWRFETTPPLSTYVTALVAGPMHAVIDDSGPITLGLYSRESLATYLEPEEMFEITRAGLDFYAEIFGQPYPFTKYDQLFVPEFNWGAMENAGCVTFSESYLFRSRVTQAARTARGATILHELAHMWFGDLVTMRWWGDLWLNESFATYMAFWALAERTRFSSAWVQFVNREAIWAIEQDQLPTTHPIVADAPDTDTAINNFDGITYAKGAMVLGQLVAWVGVEAFTSGLQDYFARNAWSNAELKDFLAALEKASGRPLGSWGQQWLETTGINTLELDFGVDADQRYTRVDVVQRTDPRRPELRDQRIAIGLYDLDGDALVRRTAVELDVTGERSAVPTLAGHRCAALIFPNDGLRSYAKVRLDDGSLTTLRGHLGRVTDPLTRAHGWMIAWDMVRDALLPAHQYVTLVSDHAQVERDSEILRTLVAQALRAADRYGAPARRSQAIATLASTARQALDASEPGSDMQLVWARCRIVVDDPTWARGLLDGSVAIDGLVVDHDLRWHAVIQLARRGAIGEDEIAAEHARDRTDEGWRHATTARAAQPLAEAKERTWALVRDHAQPLAVRRAACAGFHQYEQVDLLRPYADRYVEELPQMWVDHHRQESIDLTERLFPVTVIDQATATAVEPVLELPSVPDAGKRLVLEQLDHLRRALRTRAADA